MAKRYHEPVHRALPFLLVLLSAPAWAGPPEDAAVAAATALDEHCANDLLGTNVTRKAGSLKEVASVWEDVSVAYDASPELYLLYWRGALAQCLGGFDDNARTDLETFWQRAADDPALVDQRRDAAQRLRRLGVKVSDDVERPRAALGIGVGMVAAGGAFGALSGWQASELVQAEADYTAGGMTTAQVDAARDRGVTAATATNALGSAAVGLAVASVPLFLVDALLFSPRTRARTATQARTRLAQRSPQVLPLLGASPDGSLSLTLVGRW